MGYFEHQNKNLTIILHYCKWNRNLESTVIRYKETLFITPWTVARREPLSMRFSRQEYWSGLPCPPPGVLPDPGTEPESHVSCIGRWVLYQQDHLGSPKAEITEARRISPFRLLYCEGRQVSLWFTQSSFLCLQHDDAGEEFPLWSWLAELLFMASILWKTIQWMLSELSLYGFTVWGFTL